MIRTLLLLALLTFGGPAGALAQANVPQKRGTPIPAQKSDNQSSSPAAADEPRALQPGTPKPVPVPAVSAFGESWCDANANQYFAVGGNTYRRGPLLEISHDASGSTAFAPPTPEKLDPGGEIGYRDFAVTASGKVYELLQNQNDQGIVAVSFNSDGSVRHTTRLETPEHLEAKSLAVFDDGTILIQGFIRLKPGEDAARSYVALFEENGKLRRQLSGFPDVNLALRKAALQDRGLAIGQDGNAYVLGADSISVISESGELVRQLPYRKPNPALVARSLRFSDGLLAINVVQVKGVEVTRSYLIVRADSGETIGYYKLPDQTNAFGMCFSRSEGFTFLTLRDGKLALVNAPMR